MQLSIAIRESFDSKPCYDRRADFIMDFFHLIVSRNNVDTESLCSFMFVYLFKDTFFVQKQTNKSLMGGWKNESNPHTAACHWVSECLPLISDVPSTRWQWVRVNWTICLRTPYISMIMNTVRNNFDLLGICGTCAVIAQRSTFVHVLSLAYYILHVTYWIKPTFQGRS